MSKRPDINEYVHFNDTYVPLVPEGNITELLEQLQHTAVEYLSVLSEEQALYRYAEGKWSVKEVIGHISDTEAIMSYRLLRIARGDQTMLPGFEQDDYIAAASFDSLTIAELIERYVSVRRSTLSLLRTLKDDAWSRRGYANNAEVSVNALAYIIAGHELHHMNIIKERYMA